MMNAKNSHSAKNYLDRIAAAEYLGMSEKAFRTAAARIGLPRMEMSARRVYYVRQVLDKYKADLLAAMKVSGGGSKGARLPCL